MSINHHFDQQSMKENINSNILHCNLDPKSTNQKQVPQPYKKQLFRQANNASQTNSQKQIKKAAYIVDSDEEKSPQRYTSKLNLNKSIDDVSQIIESLQRDVSMPTSPKAYGEVPQTARVIGTCQTHQQSINSYNFCIECASYLMCPSCVKSLHSCHMILTFTTEPQTKYLTKQFLIEKVEQTLQKLKSKENDIKNKSTEMDLILIKVKKMEDEVFNKLEMVFREIGEIARNVYEREQVMYERKLDRFYEEYNGVGDQLRENLLTIIEESFDIRTFDSRWVSKEPPQVPDQQINRFKSTLQKTKKFYKSIIQSLQELKQKVERGSKLQNSTKGHLMIPNSNSAAVRQASTKKYEKFLADNCYNNNSSGENHKSSLIRVLDTLTR